MTQQFAKLATLSLGLVLMASCSTTIRNVTSTYWTGDGLYAAYWEGDCKPVLGCGIGDGKVQWCKLQEDNSLVCVEQPAMSAVLDRKSKFGEE